MQSCESQRKKKCEKNMKEQIEEQKGQEVGGQQSQHKAVEWSFRNIFFGDVLITDFLKRQTKLLVLVVILTFLYISNRYSCELELIQISKLKENLTEIKYGALTRSSELMEKSRQSRIEEYISKRESELQTSTTPPYVIKK